MQSMARVMRARSGELWVLRECDAGENKNGAFGLRWFRLFGIFGLCQKVLFCLISKYTTDAAFKSGLGFGIAQG